MSRYSHTFPPTYKKRPNYSKLISSEERAKFAYNTNMVFRSYVDKMNTGLPLATMYSAFLSGGLQLRIKFQGAR